MSATVNTITNPSQTLNQADFLNLLVTQMSSQDPLNPESDTDFAAQLAQFSSLQATQSMATELQTLEANSLIGQTVTLTPSTGGAQVSGVVTAVQILSGVPEILVNGQVYNLSQIAAVTPTVATTSTASNATTQTSTQK
jgi:flagellar basal-body rod modification protein FlgD